MLMVLILLAGLWVAWLVSPRRVRKGALRPLIVLVVVGILLNSPITAAIALQGLTVWVPPDPGNAADAIVVLGRGPNSLYERGDEALRLWRAGRAQQVFISGMSDSQPLVDYLKLGGVPDTALSGENCSQSTRENALFTAALLKPQNTQHIVLITDPPHMLRSFLLFEQFGFTVIPHLSPIPTHVKAFNRLILASREYVALAHYFIHRRSQHHPQPDKLDYPNETALERVEQWNCRIRPSE